MTAHTLQACPRSLCPQVGYCLQKPRKDGNTALHEAAQCGDEKLLIALMRLGADRFSRNQVQAPSCHRAPCTWLVRRGRAYPGACTGKRHACFRAARLDLHQSSGSSALHQAARLYCPPQALQVIPEKMASTEMQGQLPSAVLMSCPAVALCSRTPLRPTGPFPLLAYQTLPPPPCQGAAQRMERPPAPCV